MSKKSEDEAFKKAFMGSFAIQSFRVTADGDYVAARLCYRNGLAQQFLWSSLQAIEKYLKCILLLNKIATKGLSHDLGKALKRVESRAPFQLSLSDESRDFIRYLDTYGRFRYFETPYALHRAELLRLDKAVWEIRRYCQPLNYSIKNLKGEPVDMLPYGLEEIRRSERPTPPHQFNLSGGVLEKINANQEHPARSALIWKNGYFGKKSRKSVRFSPIMRAANSPLSMHPDMLDEVLKYVHLPKDVEVAYRQEIKRKAKAK